MKRWTAILFAVILIILAVGCTDKKTEFIKPVNVFYCRNDIRYNTEDGVLHQELKEYSGFDNDLLSFLNGYLKGPESSDLYAPFPSGGQITDIVSEGENIHIILSTEFSRLSGYELTISCACISRTVLELTDCQQIHLYIDATQDSERTEIVMSRDNLLLIDTTEID
ncbi:MAG: hypothetical protein IJB47_01935 [Oscillospiraceae bacterium]|nr:hypothetical protein [Oscillospiraceae bacterium]